MKNHHKLFVATLLSTGLSANVMAADPANVNVYGQVVSAIVITPKGAVNFGTIVGGETGVVTPSTNFSCDNTGQDYGNSDGSQLTVDDVGGAGVVITAGAPADVSFNSENVKGVDANGNNATALLYAMKVYKDNDQEKCAADVGAASTVTDEISGDTKYFIGGDATSTAEAVGHKFQGSIVVTANYK